MKAIFIADAHLRDPQDQNYQLLLDFLNQQKQIDALFMLGDMFDFWIGYRHTVFSAYVPLLDCLKRLADSGVKLYFVEGNHDFNMGAYFQNNLRCTVINTDEIVEWDGRKIYLCHGDLLRPDRPYRLLRGLWRSPFIRVLSAIIHPDLVWSFAQWVCNKSPKHRNGSKHHDPTPWLKQLIESDRIGDADSLFCGHYHYPVEIIHKEIEVFALGDWIDQFSYVAMQDGEFSLQNYYP